MHVKNEDAESHEAGFRKANVSLLSAPGVTRVLLAIISVYIFSTSALVCWRSVSEYMLFNIYYFLIIGLCTLLTALSLREIKVDRRYLLADQRRLRAFVIFGLGATAWILYRYPQLFSFSLWIDEITQFQSGLFPPLQPTADPAHFAAIQQQPPIDYYLSAFARIFIGKTEFAVLSHAIAFGILSFLAFLIWLIQIRFPLILAAIPIILFAAHHTLLRFSSEARPISLAVFFSLTTLIFAYESVRQRRVCTKALSASAILLLYSLGLQPMFFISILSVSLLPMLIWRFKKLEALKLLFALGIGPFILFSPTLWEIYRESEREHQFFTNSYFELWRNSLESLSWNSFADYAYTIRYAQWAFFIPLFVLLLVPILRKFRYGKFPADTVAWALASIIFFTLFPPAFEIFWGIINWNRNIYYFILWPVGLFSLASLCIANVFRPALELKGEIWLGIIMLPLCGLGVLILNKSYVPHHKHQIEIDHSFRPNWHSIMTEAQKFDRPVLIVEVPYSELNWPPFHSIAGKFYETPPATRVVRLKVPNEKNFEIPAFRIRKALGPHNQRSDILYVMTLSDFEDAQFGKIRKQKILSTISENVDAVMKLGIGMYLFRVNDQVSPVATTERLFQKIIEADAVSNRNFYLADALANASIRKAECQPARKWLEVMEAVVSRQKADPKLTKYLTQTKRSIDQISSCEGNMGNDFATAAKRPSGRVDSRETVYEAVSSI